MSSTISSTPSAANTVISSTGIGSGLDINSIVTSLTTAAGLAQNTQLSDRKSSLTALRHFFAWAKAHHVVLVNPTRGVTAREPRGFRGSTLDLPAQRKLFRRWTTDPDVHPHEAMVGLLALLHGATNQELRDLTIDDIDPASRSIRLGSRPQPTPLDPASWAALQRCLAHHGQITTGNPYVLVTRGTKATQAPASTYYLSHVLDAVGVRPRMLRSTP